MIVIILLFFCSFSIRLAHAANVCPLDDPTKWEYQYTTNEVKKIDMITDSERIKCCRQRGGDILCDHYLKKVVNEGENGNGGSPNMGVNYCTGLSSTLVFIGHIVRIAKIFIPIIVIGFGMMDFFKAITGSKDDEIKKSLRSLLLRTLAGVCIFFLPAVIGLVFSWVDSWGSYEGSYNECFKCIWDVGSCQ